MELVQPGEDASRTGENLMAAFQHRQGCNQENGARLFTEVPGQKMRNNVRKSR